MGKTDDKSRSLRDDIEEIPGEVQPEDMRDPFLKAVEALADITGKESVSVSERVLAARQLETMYQTVLYKWFAKETVDKLDRTNRAAIDEVRKNRQKPWDKSEDDE